MMVEICDTVRCGIDGAWMSLRWPLVCWEAVMRETTSRAVGRWAVVPALVIVVVAGLVAGSTAGAGVGVRPATPGGHVLAHDGTIIVEN
jgi:hypothetical protein